MGDVLSAIVPLFAVVFLGFAAGKRLPVFDAVGAHKLNALVFYFAIPALAFRTVAGAAADGGLEPLGLVAYVGGEAAVFAFAALLGWLAWRRSMAGCVVMGLGASFSNGFYMALPITFALFGEAGVVQLLLILAFDTMVLLPFAMVLLDIAKARDIESGRRGGRTRGSGRALVTAFGNVVRNPVVLATVAGLAIGVAGLPLPALVDKTLGLIGQAALPCALFAIGCDLAHRGVANEPGAVATVVLGKLALHPLAVLGLGLAIGLPPLTLAVATLAPAMPVGTTVYIAARQYEAAVGIATTSILLATAIAVASISAVMFAMQTLGLLP
ncbi:MAG: AEC family transporter [Alphaproteobacteria bacterium]|nr:AEC family transporter [Alphaproteobacteria bacterium]MCB9928302.1 AEC family transporter [Alphaproteobacteria bacterium]